MNISATTSPLSFLPTEIWDHILGYLLLKDLAVWNRAFKKARTLSHLASFRIYTRYFPKAEYHPNRVYLKLLFKGLSLKHQRLLRCIIDGNSSELASYCKQESIGFADLWQENKRGNLILNFVNERQLDLLHSIIPIKERVIEPEVEVEIEEEAEIDYDQYFERNEERLVREESNLYLVRGSLKDIKCFIDLNTWDVLCKKKSLPDMASFAPTESEFINNLVKLLIRVHRFEDAQKLIPFLEEHDISFSKIANDLFMLSIYEHSSSLCQFLLELGKISLHSLAYFKGSLISHALEARAEDAFISFLLQKNAYPTNLSVLWTRPLLKQVCFKQFESNLLLIQACKEGALNIAQQLVEQYSANVSSEIQLEGTDIEEMKEDEITDYFYTPLLATLESNKPKPLFEYLLTKGAQLNQTDSKKISIVWKAAIWDHYSLAESCIEKGATVDAEALIELLDEKIKEAEEKEKTELEQQESPHKEEAEEPFQSVEGKEEALKLRKYLANNFFSQYTNRKRKNNEDDTFEGSPTLT